MRTAAERERLSRNPKNISDVRDDLPKSKNCIEAADRMKTAHRFSPDSGHIAASHRSATKSADARRGGGRMTVNFAKLPELLRRSPPMSEASQIAAVHFTTVRATSSRSIGDGEAHSSRQREYGARGVWQLF
jgi:hypothetical protein